MSPTRFADVNASSSAVFKETNFMATVFRGSNGGPVRARNTTSRSQEGMRCLSGTLSHLTPAIKRDASGCLPGELSLMPAWQAEMAAIHFESGSRLPLIKQLL